MSTPGIGHVPAMRRLILIDGQDFTHAFTVSGPPMPEGTVVQLHLMTPDRSDLYGVWPVTETVDGWVAFIEAADHADIPHGAWFRVYVSYPSGPTTCWVAGPVERNQR